LAELSGFALRPLLLEDRKRLLEWRNSDPVRTQMFNPQQIDPADHAEWFATAIAADPDRYQILLSEGRAIGFVSFAPVEGRPGTWTWGLYVGAADAPRGSGTALGTLALHHATTRLKAHAVRSEAMAGNTRAIRLYERLGFRPAGTRTIRRPGSGSDEQVAVFEIELTPPADAAAERAG
jgi:UDP-4-amino-4,6-dideoxy-N-acetyl-beta-L-altrosamine N-acetyltransferase